MSSDTSPNQSTGRDFALDFVRALAIVEVVLAHTNLPPLVFQLRNFGVPLLLVISGMAFALRYRDRRFSAGGYTLRRIRKLLLPTWAFLVLFFVVSYVLDAIGALPGRFSARYILESFLLDNDAGYVWVIRVNLLVALLAGLLLFIDRRTSPAILVVCVLLGFVGNELLWRAFIMSPLIAGDLGDAIKQNVFYAISYGAMFLLGMGVPRLPRWSVLALAGLAALVFGGIALWYFLEAGLFVPTQSFKYPPRAYYIGYALAIGLSIIAFRNELAALVPEGALRHVVSFIGSNTLWIYLWHILMLRIVERLVEVTPLLNHWLVVWFGTVILSVLATWLQHVAWQRLKRRPPVPVN